MSVIRVTATTIGQGNPSLAGAGKPYRYRGDPRWTPGSYRGEAAVPDGPLPQNAKATAGRAARLAEFGGYLKQGLTAKQAGKLMGIAPSTARTYERDLKEQRGESVP